MLTTSGTTFTLVNGALQAASAERNFAVNRDRTAASIHWGYEQLAKYEAIRPSLFATSLVGLALSVSMITKRRRVPEAVTLYSVLAAMSAGAAWFTRPDALRPAPAPVPPAAPGEDDSGQGAMAMVLGWADRKAQVLDATYGPHWRDATWRRLARDTGFDTMHPYAESILALNRR